MFIPTKIDKNLGVSLIKKNNKISICIVKKEKENKIKLVKDIDKDFPFSNPLISNNSVKIFEFIIETNNYAKRLKQKKNFNEIDKLEEDINNSLQDFNKF